MRTIITICVVMVALHASAQIDTNPTKIPFDIDGIGSKFACNPDNAYLLDYQPKENEDEGGTMIIYDEDLKVVRTINLNTSPVNLWIYDLNDNPYAYDLYASQSLFNDDEKFEYVTSPGLDSDSGTEPEVVNIVSEDGTVLQSLTVPANSGLDILIVGKNRYLSIIPNEDDGFRYMYKINKSKDPSEVSISNVPVKMKVSPRIADRNQDITVALEGDGIKVIVVTDVAGKVVYTTKAEPGQNSVTFNSRHLSYGLNIINVRSENGKEESSKVVVK
ncbi:MAG: T9SS type A sorting domain-containing protein [Prevotella sp.]